MDRKHGWLLDDIHNRDTIGGVRMKRITIITVLIVLATILVSSCSLNSLRPFPYGKWENAELGLVLDVNPQNNIPGQGRDSFFGTYMESGEEIEVYVYFDVIHGDLWILRNPDWGSRGGERNTETSIFGGRYRLRRERLHFTLTSFWQEQTGITDTIIFERVVDYQVS